MSSRSGLINNLDLRYKPKNSPPLLSLLHFPVSIAPLSTFPPKLPGPPFLDSPTHQSPLFPFLPLPTLWYLSQSACQMVPFPFLLQPGCHLQAITPASPCLLLLLFHPHPLCLGPHHLWLLHTLLHTLCIPTPYTWSVFTRRIPQGLAVHLYHSVDRPGPVYLFQCSTPWCHLQGTCSLRRALIKSQWKRFWKSSWKNWSPSLRETWHVEWLRVLLSGYLMSGGTVRRRKQR